MTARELAFYLLGRHSRIRYPHLDIIMAAVLSDKNGNFGWNINTKGLRGGIHAEEGAFRRANPKRLCGATLTVVGLRLESGNLLCSRPCERRCLGLAIKHGIGKIEYINQARIWVVEVL